MTGIVQSICDCSDGPDDQAGAICICIWLGTFVCLGVLVWLNGEHASLWCGIGCWSTSIFP